MPPRGHSRAAVCAKVGLQPRQVIDWAEKGVVLTVRGAARFLRFLRTRPPAFLRTIGALRLARTRDGRLHVVGLSPCGARHWEVLAAPRRSQRPPEDVVLWVVLDLDAARRRLKS